MIWLPVAGGLVTLAFGDQRARAARWAALVSSLLTLAACVPLYTGFANGTAKFQFIERMPWIPTLKSQYYLGVDGISLPLILLTAFMTVPVIIAGWSVVEKRPAQYYAAFLIMEGLMIGVFASLDSLLFYFFWEAMLIPMFVIIGVWGGPRRVYATLKFFLYTFLGSVLMLVALIYPVPEGGRLQHRSDAAAAADAGRSSAGFSSRSCWRSRSRCRCGRCTPGCPMRTSRHPPAAR